YTLLLDTLLLALVDDLVIGFDDIFLLPTGARACARTCACRRTTRLTSAARAFRRAAAALALRVERLPGFAERAVQLFLRRADLVHVVAAKRLAGPLDRRVELRLELGGQLVRPLLRLLLDLIRHAVEPVARIDLLATLLVFRRVLLGI